MRLQERYGLVMFFAVAVAFVTAACDDGRTPVAPSASVATTNLSVAGEPSAAAGGSVAAQSSKVDVCHVEGNGSFHLINVSENALPAHLATATRNRATRCQVSKVKNLTKSATRWTC